MKAKAFPNKGYDTAIFDGMDLRDYFASHAMQGLLTQGEAYLDLKAASYEKNAFWEYVADISYTLADAMIEARNDNK